MPVWVELTSEVLWFALMWAAPLLLGLALAATLAAGLGALLRLREPSPLLAVRALVLLLLLVMLAPWMGEEWKRYAVRTLARVAQVEGHALSPRAAASPAQRP